MPAKTIEQAKAACADESRLRQALDGADIVPLMMSLVHLTGDARWLDEAAPHIKGGWSFLANLPGRAAAAHPRRARRDVEGHRHRSCAACADFRRTAHAHDAHVGRADRAVRNTTPSFARKPASISATTAQCRGANPFRRSSSRIFTSSSSARAFPASEWPIKLEEAGIPTPSSRRTRMSAAPGWRTAIPAAASTRRATSSPTRSRPIPNGRRSSPSATRSCNTSSIASNDYGIRKSIRFGEEVIDARYDEDERAFGGSARARATAPSAT